MRLLVRVAASMAVAALLTGCVRIQPQRAFDDVRAQVEARGPYRVTWATGAEEDAEVARAVEALLADSLTADRAVQVALLNNRRLQARYEDLGVAQADLVQAGLLANPLFGGRAAWPLDGGAPDLGFHVAFEFLDVFYLPLRKAVAESAFEAAQLRVSGAVLDFAARTRTAYVRAQAGAARLALQQRIVANAEAAYQAALLLREAGNVPATDVLAEQALYEQARLDLLAAEDEAMERREALVRLMGLFGGALDFTLSHALAPVPETEVLPLATGDVLDVAALEQAALDASLDLAAARQDVTTVAQRLGLAAPESILPDLDVGGELEREEGEWKAGPEAEVALPLFDQGQAQRAGLRAELRRSRALYHATGVEVRAAARTLARRLATTRRTALHYQRVVLPLRTRLVEQTLLQYNAMQTGVFGVLQAQQFETEAARRYLDVLSAYWETRADLDLLLQGRMPDLDGSGLSQSPSAARPVRDVDH